MKAKFLIPLLFTATSLFAQRDFKQLHIYFDSIEKHHTFSGSAALTKNAQLLFNREFGVLDGAKSTAVNSESKFRIGSISKTFTAALIMKAVEEGKLKTSDKLKKYHPEIVNAKSITIEHLLRHTSGMFNYTNDSLFWQQHLEPISKEKQIEKLAHYPSDFKPGTQYSYSNSGYYILACILEKVYNKTYDELLQEKIVVPLNLKNTYEGTTLRLENNEALSVLYSFSNQKWINGPLTHSSHILGAGGMVSTPTELNIFMTALMNGKVVNDKSLTLMKTMKFNYGYGLLPLPYHLHVAYGHTGGIDTYSSVTGYFEDEALAFSLTLNGYEESMNDVLIAMLAGYFGDSIKMPNPINFFPIQKDLLKSYEGTYTNAQYKLTLTVRMDEYDNTLKFKLDAQPEIKSIPTSSTVFEVPMVSAKFTLNKGNNTVTLNQNSNKIEFKK